MSDNNSTLLSVSNLKVWFPIKRNALWRQKCFVRAVDGVDFDILRGKTLGLVGESGCGKTTVGRAILRLINATEGKVIYNGYDIFSMSESQLRKLRGRMQIIFQDPISSLDPRMTVASIVAEPLAVQSGLSRAQRKERVAELLQMVGLSPQYMNRYPHEFSGGQRQRIGLARALASRPDFIVCDEPLSALDVSIQAQILNLLGDLQNQMGISYLFISHNLAVVEHFADTVAVMYLGKIVEIADRDSLFSRPLHPYTRCLLSAIPMPEPSTRANSVIVSGETPSAITPPQGCAFHPRCPIAQDECRKREPQLVTKENQRLVRCFYAQ